jgi:hypothetical protein
MSISYIVTVFAVELITPRLRTLPRGLIAIAPNMQIKTGCGLLTNLMDQLCFSEHEPADLAHVLD